MAQSFMGKTIYLISQSDIRYRGTLAGVDPAASTIQLSNVYSMGTENRRSADQFIPPNPDPYHYIVFRASEVKDLAVDHEPVPPPPPQRNLPDDPAILSTQAQNPNANPNPHPAYSQVAVPVAAPGTVADSDTSTRRQPDNYENGRGRGGRRGGGGGRGGHYQNQNNGRMEIAVPATDFDFQSSNARFDKTSLAPTSAISPAANGDEQATTPSDPGAYNPKSSFFDSLSSSNDGQPGQAGQQGQHAPGGGQGGYRGRGGRGRGYGRSRREEERQKNVATFGEPGGLGLMGPGAYVGGYGRRGRGGRRGGGAPGQ